MASIKFLNEFELISCGINDHTIKLWDIRKFRDYRDAKLILKSPTDRGFTSLGSLNNSIYASCLDGSVYEFGLTQTQELDFNSIFSTKFLVKIFIRYSKFRIFKKKIEKFYYEKWTCFKRRRPAEHLQVMHVRDREAFIYLWVWIHNWKNFLLDQLMEMLEFIVLITITALKR